MIRIKGKNGAVYLYEDRSYRDRDGVELGFDLLGIKYVYKGEPQNDDLTPPEEL